MQSAATCARLRRSHITPVDQRLDVLWVGSSILRRSNTWNHAIWESIQQGILTWSI